MGAAAAGTAASSRLLETIEVAHGFLAGRGPGPEVASLLFYIDCEAFSTLGRPVTELPWTRVFASPAAVVFDAIEAGIVTRWLDRHSSELVLGDEVPAGTHWLSGVEVMVIRHAVDEFCGFGKRELRFVRRVRERASASSSVTSAQADAYDWGEVDSFVSKTRDWLGEINFGMGPGDAPDTTLLDAEEAALHRETLLSIATSK